MTRPLTLALVLLTPHLLAAADWPEWRGAGRTGVWTESKIRKTFPVEGLPIGWSVPIHGGYAGPAVSRNRVFVTDYAAGEERALAYEERTGRKLWQHAWPAMYGPLQYNSGPRATPTVDGDRVYFLGAVGELRCLGAATGELIWSRNFPRDFGTEIPAWGTTSAPLIYGDTLIAVVGGRPDSKVVAFDKRTGKERWRALSSVDSEAGYSQPILTDGKLVVWHAGAVSMLDPGTGKLLWEHPFQVKMSTPIATPVVAGPYLLVTAFFQGARLLKLSDGELRWRGNSENELQSETLHSALTTPVMNGDYIYGMCAYGQLRCLRLSTGERVWETLDLLKEKARNGSAFFVRQGDRYLIHTDRGELVSARLTPQGYEEQSRVKIITPTTKPGGRRLLGAVNWVHPAFANGHIIIRNDEEMVRVDLRE